MVFYSVILRIFFFFSFLYRVFVKSVILVELEISSIFCHRIENPKFFTLTCHFCCAHPDCTDLEELVVLKVLGSCFIALVWTCLLRWVLAACEEIKFQHLLTGSVETGLDRCWSVLYGQPTPSFISKTNFYALPLTHDISTNCH